MDGNHLSILTSGSHCPARLYYTNVVTFPSYYQQRSILTSVPATSLAYKIFDTDHIEFIRKLAGLLVQEVLALVGKLLVEEHTLAALILAVVDSLLCVMNLDRSCT